MLFNCTRPAQQVFFFFKGLFEAQFIGLGQICGPRLFFKLTKKIHFLSNLRHTHPCSKFVSRKRLNHQYKTATKTASSSHQIPHANHYSLLPAAHVAYRSHSFAGCQAVISRNHGYQVSCFCYLQRRCWGRWEVERGAAWTLPDSNKSLLSVL